MIDPKMKTLGLKDMHKVQSTALLNFVGNALQNAAYCKDKNILKEAALEADELIQLFGGLGIDLKVD
jgi:hypothetical protein|tara:strand:- start:4241 stop:4441 length:201 start_codon:yes stop_codon:yes gene_type:complete